MSSVSRCHSLRHSLPCATLQPQEEENARIEALPDDTKRSVQTVSVDKWSTARYYWCILFLLCLICGTWWLFLARASRCTWPTLHGVMCCTELEAPFTDDLDKHGEHLLMWFSFLMLNFKPLIGQVAVSKPAAHEASLDFMSWRWICSVYLPSTTRTKSVYVWFLHD